ncbi:MAG: PASTA domain-containing protein [Cyclobacteriaceae bacterium]|jgi:beta-lactam-binding protein with PASTA domain|nr:PASTA domain-containing protein [Cyclobacteriaceae bacterium]MDH4297850.1 PASTA domain-containing protein [Cyclobacteriaceae bacterium]MDH5247762.1 PASTA domain-containing protein [Cyclobacteriaceae bacterium]
MKFDIRKFKIDTFGGFLLHSLLAATTLLVLLLFYFYAYLPNTTNHGETITVPSIEGMQIAQLEEFLIKRNLRYEVNDSSYSSEYPALTVLKQYPQAGSKVKEGRKIFISINRISPPTVPVPALVDGSVVNADAVLRSNELKRGRIELVAGPFNVVKEMKYQGRTIEAGEPVPKGSVIDLVVMDGGSNSFEAPDFIGLNLEDAKVVIFGSNLNLGSIIVVGDTLGNEVFILKQKPEPYENIKVGDVVDLWIGAAGTTVPDEDDI